jgi:hypothetical protein
VIDTLKTAYVHGMLAKDEFDLRVSQAFASRTHAELAAVTADLPAEPTTAKPPKPAYTQGEQPVLRTGPLITVATALCAGVWMFGLLVPWPKNSEGELPGGVVLLVSLSTLMYLFVLVIAVGFMIANWREKRSGGQPPQRPAPGAGGQASRRPPSADPGGELPPVDRGHQHTTEAARSRPPRTPLPGSRPLRRWRSRGLGAATAGSRHAISVP